MKRTKLAVELSLFPKAFHTLLEGATVYDSSCSPEARVYYVDRDDGYYLKSAPKGSLQREAELTRYFHKKQLATEVLDYRSEDRDWLLTRRMHGEDCTHRIYLDDPKRLSVLLGERLRALHETDFADCPVQNRMKEYFETAKKNYESGAYDLSFFETCYGSATVESIWNTVNQNAHLLQNDTLLHGDYCLPNVMLDDWSFSGFIDLGNGGVGDRHVDLFWGAWTLWFNLHTDDYRDRFFDAYGRDQIDFERLKIVAAAEVFG